MVEALNKPNRAPSKNKTSVSSTGLVWLHWSLIPLLIGFVFIYTARGDFRATDRFHRMLAPVFPVLTAYVVYYLFRLFRSRGSERIWPLVVGWYAFSFLHFHALGVSPAIELLSPNGPALKLPLYPLAGAAFFGAYFLFRHNRIKILIHSFPIFFLAAIALIPIVTGNLKLPFLFSDMKSLDVLYWFSLIISISGLAARTVGTHQVKSRNKPKGAPLVSIRELIRWLLLSLIPGVSLILLGRPDMGFITLLLAPALFFFIRGGSTDLFQLIINCGLLFPAFFLFYNPLKSKLEPWRSPWNQPDGAGADLLRALFRLTSGRWIGLAPADGAASGSDAAGPYAYAVFSEFWGLVGGALLILLILALVGEGIAIAGRAGSAFNQLTALGVALVALSAALIHVAGSTGLIPNLGASMPLFVTTPVSFCLWFAFFGLLPALDDA